MAGIRRHGAHRVTLSIPAAAAGSAADTVGSTFVYDAYAAGNTSAAATVGFDNTAETITECVLTTYVALTGQATNFVSPRLTHRNAAGTIQNQITVAFSAAGVVTVAFVPVNLYVASGATVPGAGTGTLAVGTGVALTAGWALVAGDTITLDRVSNNATGLATPAMSATFLVQVKGA